MADAPTSADRNDRLRALLDARMARAASRGPAIPPRPGGPAPLSPMQEGIWLSEQMRPGSTTYHRPTAFRLTGTLDADALRAALGDLAARHEAFRTTVVLDEAGPRQHIRSEAVLSLDTTDVSASPDPERAALDFAAQAAREPFDLARGPLVHAHLVRLAATEHLLVLLFHHLVFDGWSEGALRADLAVAYAARADGRAPQWEPLAVQPADIAAWSRTRDVSDALAYWSTQLDGLPTTLDLPTDWPRARATDAAARLTFTLPEPLADRLRALARAERATLYHVLLAGLQVLLARVARQTDFGVGTPVAGRTHAEMEGVVGCLINLLVVRARVDLDTSFREHLADVRATVVDALAHQEAPLPDVVARVFPDRRDFGPIYHVLFQLKNLPAIDTAGSLHIEPVAVREGGADTDLALSVVDRGALHGTLVYRSDLFDAATIQRLAGHYATLLAAAVDAPETPIGALPMITRAERHHLLDGVQVPVPPPIDRQAIHELFEDQVARQPEAPAVEMGDTVWTYGQLNAYANRLAWQLRDRGVGPGTVVALGLGQCPELVGAVLAVHKAGGAYLPLDPGDPGARAATLLHAADSRLLLTRGPSPWPDLDAKTLDMDALDLDGEPDTNPPTDAYPRDRPAYVLFTSGSTGTPKGVVITQANLLAGVPGWAEVYQLGRREAFVQTAKPTFDVFSEAWIRTLGFGLRLVLCPRDSLLDPAAFVRLVREHGVDAVSGVPAVFRLLTAHLEANGETLDRVGLAIVGADVWRPDDHARLQAVLPNASVQNTYGITETTVSNTVFSGDAPALPSGTVPIGRAYPGSRLYVLDDRREPVPLGVPGELYVGGPIVGVGYLGRPDLTAERFLPDPFVDTPGARMYRSGDLVRRLPSGDLDFLGRADFQVKIRGQRIELGEIEAVLMDDPSVDQAVAVVQGDVDDGHIVGFVVPATGATPDPVDLRDRARRRLPRHMVPAIIAVLDALPLSANRKVDRRALPTLSVQAAPATEGAPPQTSTERSLAELWRDVLGLAAIRRDDDFFDLGGHSLRAVQVLARVSARWGTSLSFRDVVEAPTLAAFAARIDMEEPGAARATTADSDEVDELLNALEGLSDEEVAALLRDAPDS